jgi:lipopolysaccharide exporter
VRAVKRRVADPDAPDPAPAEGIATRVSAGAAWSIAAMIFARLAGFLALLVLARLLAPEAFGVVAAVVVFVGFLELASDAGMKASVVYEQERGITRRVQTAFSISIVASIALTGVAIALAPVLAGFFRIEDHTDLFRLASLNVLLTGLGNVQDGVLQRDLSFRTRLIAELLRAIVRAVVSIGLAVEGFGAVSLVWGLLAGSAAWVVFLTAATRMPWRFRIDLHAARSMASYGAGSAALAAIVAIATRLDAALIGRLLGERSLGIYTVAFRLPELAIQAVAWQLSVVAFPALSRKRVMDEQGLPSATLRLVRMQALYVLPVAAGICVLAEPLVDVLFGEAWREAAAVLIPVSILSAAFSIVFPLGDLLKATGRQGLLVALNVLTVPVMAAGILLAAPYGLVAVAWVRVGTTVCFVSLLLLAAAHVAHVSLMAFLRAVTPAAVAAVGVVAGAATARLALAAPSGAELVVAAACGAGTSAVLVSVLARGTLAELRASLPAVAWRRGRPAPPAAAGGPGERA